VGRANKAKVSGYVVLLRLRWDIYAKWKEIGVWPDDVEANKALEGYASYWSQQLKQGRALLGQRSDDRVRSGFTTGSRDAADK
jgi:hypothetical protein